MKSDYTKDILKTYPDSRSDDNILIYFHLKSLGIFLTPEQVRKLKEGTKNTVSLYDLVRYHQKIQSKNDTLFEASLLGTYEVMEKRHKKGVVRTQEERQSKRVKRKINHAPANWQNISWIDQEGRSFTI